MTTDERSRQYRLKESIWQYIKISLFEFEKTNGCWHVALLSVATQSQGALLRIERTANGEWFYDMLWADLWRKV